MGTCIKKRIQNRTRKVTKFIKQTAHESIEVLSSESQAFQEDINAITDVSRDRIVNTDQMGCEYGAEVERTLAVRGEKIVEVHLGDLNKVTHSYTGQYAIHAAGGVLPKVLTCLQEPKGEFGPRIQERMENLSMQYKNVYITCSKSGKLSTGLVSKFLDEVLVPYAKKDPFYLILDSCSGQKQPRFYGRFGDRDENPTCTTKFIPPDCTSMCQPLVHLYTGR